MAKLERDSPLIKQPDTRSLHKDEAVSYRLLGDFDPGEMRPDSSCSGSVNSRSSARCVHAM